MFYKTRKVLLAGLALCVANAEASEAIKQFVDLAIENNFSLQAEKYETVAVEKQATSAYTLDSPRVGISQLDRGNETKYWTISQKVDFPTKYYYKGKAQAAKSKVYGYKEAIKASEVRAQVIKTLYMYHANQKTRQLTETNLSLVKDAARTAEKRYAARKSSQSDSMKAHFEITKLELELLKIDNQQADILAQLENLLGGQKPDKEALEKLALSVPKLSEVRRGDNTLQSPFLSMQESQVEVARLEKNNAISDFAPDFQIQYQQRYSGLPEESSIFSVNASIPLWFWSDSSKVSSKRAQLNAEQSRLSQKKLELQSLKNSMQKKIQLMKKSLVIYETTLLPQAEGAFSTTKKSYSAGTLRFIDLLDAERSLIKVKTEFYKELVGFVQLIVEYETLFGVSVSDLYFVDGGVES